MPLYAYNIIVDLSAAPVNLNTLDIVQIGMNGYVYSTSAAPFQSVAGISADGVRISVQGTVAGYNSAILLGLGLSDVFNTSLTVSATGVIDGWNSIWIDGRQTSILNMGQISGQSSAIYLGQGNGAAGVTTIVNAGSIAGDNAAIRVYGVNDESIVIDNTGIIGMRQTGWAFLADATTIGNDVIRNHGLMVGLVTMGGGDDLYDGRGGRVTNTVAGDTGDDIFMPGLWEEVFDGGVGVDWLDFRATSLVQIALDGSFNAAGRMMMTPISASRESGGRAAAMTICAATAATTA